MESNKKIISLIAKNGEKIDISLKAALRSGLINMNIELNPDSKEIPLNVEFNILKKIIEYLEHYENEEPKEIERPLPSTNFKDCVEEWDYNFIGNDTEFINQIILASNYLDIKPLLELSSSALTSQIKGKTTQEIRKLFNITNDFTPEEEQQIIEENKWCMENL